jgi:hypothetical protein
LNIHFYKISKSHGKSLPEGCREKLKENIEIYLTGIGHGNQSCTETDLMRPQ